MRQRPSFGNRISEATRRKKWVTLTRCGLKGEERLDLLGEFGALCRSLLMGAHPDQPTAVRLTLDPGRHRSCHGAVPVARSARPLGAGPPSGGTKTQRGSPAREGCAEACHTSPEPRSAMRPRGWCQTRWLARSRTRLDRRHVRPAVEK